MRGMRGWIVVRAILVMDVIILLTVGFICLIWVTSPPGPIVASAFWMGAGGLLGLLPLTDPYHVEARRRRRRPAPRR